MSSDLNMDKDFDVYLVELKPGAKLKDTKAKHDETEAKQDEEPTVVNSQLITFESLKERATKEGVAVRDLALDKLRSRFERLLPGFFCLPGSGMARIDGSMSLSDYAEREPNAIHKEGGSLTVSWTRNVRADLADVLKGVPDVGKLPASTDKPLEKPSLNIPTFKPALETTQGISMEKSTDPDTPYKLKPEDWAHVIEGNELLYAFQVDDKQVELLRTTTLSSFVGSGFASTGNSEHKPTTTSMGGADVTSASMIDPIIPIARCVRPLFVIHPGSEVREKDTTSDAFDSTSIEIAPGPFWSNAKAVATTQIVKTQTSLQQWSLVSGMSKNSVNAGLSLPLGNVTIGAKFGFEQEKSSSKSSSTEMSETHLTAVHTIPCVQININETTVVLSPDAEFDIKKLRRERKFGDLVSFLKRYGTLIYQNITLGGRLYHTQDFSSSKQTDETMNAERFKVSANASLGIPDVVNLEGGGSKEKSSSQTQGSAAASTAENLTWSGIGGNASLSVDPPKWRESLNYYGFWKPIQFDNPVRIDQLIGRLPGYSDIPVLFSDILATGVLDPAVIAIPPEGLPGATPQLGLSIKTENNKLTIGGTAASAEQHKYVEDGPEGYSWNVLRTSRDVKREIWASLQATLNPMIKLSYVPPYLTDLRGGPTSLCIVLRWNSRSFKQIPIGDFADSIWHRGEAEFAQGNKAFLEKVWQTFETDKGKVFADEFQKADEATRVTLQAQRNTQIADHAAEHQKLLMSANQVLADEASTIKRIFVEDVLKKKEEERDKKFQEDTAKAQEQAEKDKIKQAYDVKKASDDAERLELLQVAENLIKDVKTAATSNEAHSEATKPWDKTFLVRTLTSRAWLTGIWQFQRSGSHADFEALRSKLSKYFSEPRSIEAGCDYIESETSPKNNKSIPVTVDFILYGSDGPGRKDTKIFESTSLAAAFDAINLRINMASIHVLVVKGEIGTQAGQPFPTDFVMSETALLQSQQAEAEKAFHATQHNGQKKDEQEKDEQKDDGRENNGQQQEPVA